MVGMLVARTAATSRTMSTFNAVAAPKRTPKLEGSAWCEMANSRTCDEQGRLLMETLRRYQRREGPHVARKIGVPLTRSGRHQKIGRSVTGGGCLMPFLGAVMGIGWVKLRRR